MAGFQYVTLQSSNATPTHTHMHTTYPPPPPPPPHTHTHTYTCTTLHTYQERSLDNLPPLPPTITAHFVRLCECLLGSPPDLNCLRYISDHLLVSDLNDLKFFATPNALDTSITIIDGRLQLLAFPCFNWRPLVKNGSKTYSGQKWAYVCIELNRVSKFLSSILKS